MADTNGKAILRLFEFFSGAGLRCLHQRPASMTLALHYSQGRAPFFLAASASRKNKEKWSVRGQTLFSHVYCQLLILLLTIVLYNKTQLCVRRTRALVMGENGGSPQYHQILTIPLTAVLGQQARLSISYGSEFVHVTLEGGGEGGADSMSVDIHGERRQRCLEELEIARRGMADNLGALRIVITLHLALWRMHGDMYKTMICGADASNEQADRLNAVLYMEEFLEKVRYDPMSWLLRAQFDECHSEGEPLSTVAVVPDDELGSAESMADTKDFDIVVDRKKSRPTCLTAKEKMLRGGRGLH